MQTFEVSFCGDSRNAEADQNKGNEQIQEEDEKLLSIVVAGL